MMNARTIVLGVGLAAFVSLASLALWFSSPSHAEPNDSAPLLVDAGAAPASGAPLSNKVTITINVIPAVNATVSWGKTRLGVIKPRSVLVVQRPRESGPVDLLIRANGYLAVQTRAYTFGDNKLSVRLTPLDQKSTLLGYREDLDAGPEGGLGSILPYDTDGGMWGGDY
jgi:hypothetical protein